ncbi:snRNA-activating protein complex subunit 1 - like 1 [Theobroma cacao]|nr:snRNA-activating protein complex subunit 1 - like 1 [Theobroma cacao]
MSHYDSVGYGLHALHPKSSFSLSPPLSSLPPSLSLSSPSFSLQNPRSLGLQSAFRASNRSQIASLSVFERLDGSVLLSFDDLGGYWNSRVYFMTEMAEMALMETTPEENNNQLATPETQPNKRRKKKSIVWEYFTIETVSAGCRRACCKRCKQSFAYSTGSKVAGTSHLKRHIAKGTCPALIRDQDNNQLTPYNPRMGGSEPPKRRYRSPSSPYIPFDQDRCRHEIAKMIIMHDYPLHMVEHPGFIAFVQNLQPRFDKGKFFSLTFNHPPSEAGLEYLRPLLCIKNPLIFNGQLLLGNCIARTLSSMAKDVLGAGQEIIKKIRDSVKYVKASESHDDKFVQVKNQLQVPSEKSLFLDNQTQWNTTYQMLAAASELKEVFSCLDTSDPDYKLAPSMEDWKVVETLCIFLKPLFDAVVQGTKSLKSNTKPKSLGPEPAFLSVLPSFPCIFFFFATPRIVVPVSLPPPLSSPPVLLRHTTQNPRSGGSELKMDLSTFKLDIDELIYEFVQSESTTLNDMKRVWLSRKFSYIYEASPSTNLAFFMQLGGLYCLYCLYETQPFKPPFKIYLSLGELKKLKSLVAEANEKGIRVVPTLVKRMLEKNMFLFGFVDFKEGSVSETINSLTKLQDARIQVAYEKLFTDTEIEQYLHMNLGMEVDLNMLKKLSTEYAVAKKQAIEEASEVVDVQNIKHISENKESLSEIVEKIDENWNNQREVFYQRTRLNPQPAEEEQPQQLQLQENEQEDEVADEIFQLLYQNE